MTRAQVLALVDAMTTSPKVKSHLAAVLGHKQVASADDFEVSVAEAVERSDDLISFLEEVASTLRVVHDQRPKQKELPFDPDPEPDIEPDAPPGYAPPPASRKVRGA